MSVLPIVTVPHTILRQGSRDVVVDKKIEGFCADISDTLFAKENPKGVGLSAPQVGKNWNIFVTWLAPNPEDEPTPEDLIVFINPIITDHSVETTFGPDSDDPILEGCLSIPGLYGPVPRWTWVEVEYQTMDWQTANGKGHMAINAEGQMPKVRGRFTDFSARVVQHEYDHLKGILFTDHSLQFDLPVYEYKAKKMKEIDKKIVEGF